jgi:tetratricopeptide (TPR) repeat protein
MNPAKLGVFLAATLLFACGSRDKQASIEASNKGVEAYTHESWENAIKHFEEAVKLWRKNHPAWYSLGQIYGKKDEWDKAAKALSEAVRFKDDAMYHMWLGVALYEVERKAERESGKVGNLDRAEAELARGVELNGDLFRGHWYLGRIYRDTGRPREAAEAWTRACALNPYFGKPFVRLGALYLRWDRVSEAIQVLSQGKQYVPADEDLTNIYYYLGMAYDAQAAANEAGGPSRWDKSIEAYSLAIDHRADNDQARFQRGLAYIKKGDRAKGMADLDNFLKRGSGSTFEKQEASKAMFSATGAPAPQGAVPP